MIMNKLLLLLLIIIKSIFIPSVAATPHVMEAQSTASESIESNTIVKTVVNTSFDFDKLYNQKTNNFMEILLSKKIMSSTFSGREGADSKIEVVAWIKENDKYNKKLWKIKDCADSGARSKSFYQTTKYGCCGAEALHRIYNFKTGQYIFSHTTKPASVDINIPKDRITRHISYISIRGSDSKCRNNKLPANAIGALTISDDKMQIERLLLESSDNELAWSPKISLINDEKIKGTSNLSLWSKSFVSKTDAIKGFSVKIFFYDGMEIIIPVVNGKFNIEGLSLPKSIKIQKIAVEITDAGQ